MNSQLARTHTLAVAAAVTALTLLTSGCSGGLAPSAYSKPAKPAAVALSGGVHGGQQPVSNAVIQLYAVGITGLQSASTPLISQTVTTDQNGYFTITGDWDCTSNTATYGANPLLYIVAAGGNPGISSSTNNTAINMVAALGPCNTLNGGTFIYLDEMTTVAAAYALAPFMTDVAHVGALGANPAGLVNAFNTASVLVNWSTGTAPGNLLPANATAPIAELNSLGDILSACVNTNGTDGTCSTLFNAVTPTGGNPPTDIVGVILNLAANPGLQASTLINMVPTFAPFQPVLLTPPNDWTVAVKFTGGGLNAPAALALDASGNVWVANAGGNSVTELSSTGTPLTGSTGYTGTGNILGAQGIAVDKTGNVWVADTLLSSVVELNVSSGSIQSTSSFKSGGIKGPIGIAIDSQNDVWVANFAGASVTELNSAGTAMGGSPLTASSQLQAPSGIAIDPNGRVWVTDNTASTVVEFGNDQTLLSGTGYIDTAILGPTGVAVDPNGRVWIAYPGTNAASYFSNALQQTRPLPYTGGGLSMPAALATDGQGTVWVVNGQAGGSISKLTATQSSPLSPTQGLGALNAPSAIAVDASGNLWTTNSGDNSVSEFIGLASPATLPLTANAGP